MFAHLVGVLPVALHGVSFLQGVTGTLTSLDGRIFVTLDQPLKVHGRWDWGTGITPPDQVYCERVDHRTVDPGNHSPSDSIYFDCPALPLWLVSDAGRKVAVHFAKQNNTRQGDDGSMCQKLLDVDRRRTMAWHIERGVSHQIEPEPVLPDTCLGSWHSRTNRFECDGDKAAKAVVNSLLDVVSKNETSCSASRSKPVARLIPTRSGSRRRRRRTAKLGSASKSTDGADFVVRLIRTSFPYRSPSGRSPSAHLVFYSL